MSEWETDTELEKWTKEHCIHNHISKSLRYAKHSYSLMIFAQDIKDIKQHIAAAKQFVLNRKYHPCDNITSKVLSWKKTCPTVEFSVQFQHGFLYQLQINTFRVNLQKLYN